MEVSEEVLMKRINRKLAGAHDRPVRFAKIQKVQARTMNEAYLRKQTYFRKLAEDLIGEDAKMLEAIFFLPYRALSHIGFGASGIEVGPCLGLTQHNQGFCVVNLATTLKGKKLSKTDLIETFIHELVHVRLYAQGKLKHKHDKRFNRIHLQLLLKAENFLPGNVYSDIVERWEVEQELSGWIVSEQKPCIEQSV